MNANLTHQYSPSEEVVNSVTHAVGAALGVAALAVLVTIGALQGDAWRVTAFAVYGTAIVLLYLFSTFYHLTRRPELKKFFRYLDHSAIYLLIAGTYTPFLLVKMRGVWGWSLFGTIWGLAVLGIMLNFVLIGRSRWISTSVYIGMGWLVIVAIKPLVASVAAGGIAWLVAGGLSYTLGAAFYIWKKLPYNHAVWHLFVLAGSVCHFLAILLYVAPVQS
jgi:hemolysin III